MDTEWGTVALEWVNSLRLTENPVQSVKELVDAKFFCEILQLLFRRTINVRNKPQVFLALRDNLQGMYSPNDWIDFESAFDGSLEEIVKIVTVVIGVASLHCEEKVFLENPSNYLTIDSQVKVAAFLQKVLENGKIVDARFVNFVCDKENRLPKHHHKRIEAARALAPKIMSPNANNQMQPTMVSESSHFYVSSPAKEAMSLTKSSPSTDRLSSPVLEAERFLMSEKNNEISTLKTRIEVLTACQRDLMDEISSYKDDNSKLSAKCEELMQENHAFKIRANLSKSVNLGTPQTETPERNRNLTNSLRDKLKRNENYVELLEGKLDESSEQLKRLESEMEKLKDTLQQMASRENDLVEELQRYEQERLASKLQIEQNEDVVKQLEQELEDYRDSHQMNASAGINEQDFFELSICDSYYNSCNTSHESRLQDGMPTQFEDMASAVIEVQLRETQDQLDETRELLEKREESVNALELTVVELQEMLNEKRSHSELHPLGGQDFQVMVEKKPVPDAFFLALNILLGRALTAFLKLLLLIFGTLMLILPFYKLLPSLFFVVFHGILSGDIMWYNKFGTLTHLEPPVI